MEDSIITWNVPNWITVLLMVFLGFFLIGFFGQSWQKWRGSNA